VSEVTVFVDDAVMGTLPSVCAKEGVATDDRLTVRTDVGLGAGLGVAWLLILAGPLGWLALFIIAFTHRPSDLLTVKLPLCGYAYQRYRVARRMRSIWLIAAFVAAVLVPAIYMTHRPASTVATLVLGLFALAAFVVGLREWRRTRVAAVRVDLDASRRWVTLSGVHPDFAQAVQNQAERDPLDRL
jgi:hypothetical protein